MLENSQLFLSTLIDLREKLEESTQYSLTMASGLLRKLFLDNHPLVHQANRAHRIKLEFETIDFTLRLPIKPQIHWQNLDTSRLPTAKTIKINLDQFLRAEVLNYNGYEYSVKDLISTYANVGGGVHADPTKDQKQETVSELDRILKVIGLDAGLAALRGIILVVLKALEPLEKCVRQEA